MCEFTSRPKRESDKEENKVNRQPDIQSFSRPDRRTNRQTDTQTADRDVVEAGVFSLVERSS